VRQVVDIAGDAGVPLMPEAVERMGTRARGLVAGMLDQERQMKDDVAAEVEAKYGGPPMDRWDRIEAGAAARDAQEAAERAAEEERQAQAVAEQRNRIMGLYHPASASELEKPRAYQLPSGRTVTVQPGIYSDDPGMIARAGAPGADRVPITRSRPAPPSVTYDAATRAAMKMRSEQENQRLSKRRQKAAELGQLRGAGIQNPLAPSFVAEMMGQFGGPAGQPGAPGGPGGGMGNALVGMGMAMRNPGMVQQGLAMQQMEMQQGPKPLTELDKAEMGLRKAQTAQIEDEMNHPLAGYPPAILEGMTVDDIAKLTAHSRLKQQLGPEQEHRLFDPTDGVWRQWSVDIYTRTKDYDRTLDILQRKGLSLDTAKQVMQGTLHVTQKKDGTWVSTPPEQPAAPPTAVPDIPSILSSPLGGPP
jgi:hypothetical protein